MSTQTVPINVPVGHIIANSRWTGSTLVTNLQCRFCSGSVCTGFLRDPEFNSACSFDTPVKVVMGLFEYSWMFGAFSFVPLSEFVGRPSWTKSGP